MEGKKELNGTAFTDQKDPLLELQELSQKHNGNLHTNGVVSHHANGAGSRYGNGAVKPFVLDLSDEEVEDVKKDPSLINFISRTLKKQLLLVLSIVGIVVGFIIGFAIRPTHPSPTVIMWLGLPGDIFMNLLKMTVVPVIISSILTATTTLEPKENGKMSVLLFVFLIGTNLFGAILGTVLAIIIKPGSQHFMLEDMDTTKTVNPAIKTEDIFLDLIRNLFPENIVRATVQKYQTTYEKSIREVANSTADFNSTMTVLTRGSTWANSTNVLGLVFCAVIFGLATGQAKEHGKPFLAFFQSTMNIMIIILRWFMWTAPIGVCSLIASSIAGIPNLEAIFTSLGLMVATVCSGLAIQQLVFLPLLHFILTRTNPYFIFLKSIKVWCVAFASAASICSMPYMFETAKELRYDSRIYNFVIPIAVTLNANGSALFICVASAFLSQINQLVFNVTQAFVVVLLTTISSLALPSVPSASLVTVVIISTTLGIPPTSIGLLFAVEWLLDRLRTTSNVLSEMYCVSFLNNFCKKDLEVMDRIHCSQVNQDELRGTLQLTAKTIDAVSFKSI